HEPLPISSLHPKASTSDSYRSQLCLPAHPKNLPTPSGSLTVRTDDSRQAGISFSHGSSSIVRGYDRSGLVLLDETGLYSSSSILTILPDTSNPGTRTGKLGPPCPPGYGPLNLPAEASVQAGPKRLWVYL